MPFSMMCPLVVIAACLTSIVDGSTNKFAHKDHSRKHGKLGNLAEFLLAVNPSISRANPSAIPPSAAISSPVYARSEGARMQSYMGIAAVMPQEVPVTPASPPEEFEFLPIYPKIERVEGGGTVRTYQMPLWADRCQYMLRTEGRPLKAEVNLWIGPLRQVHTCRVDSENGALTPVHGTIKFKKLAPVLKIFTDKELTYPIEAAVVVPSPDRSKQLEDHFMKIWRSAQKPYEKQLIQGGMIEGTSSSGKGGAVRSWTIPPEVESIEVLGWSGDVGKKSFKMDFEVLQSVNNVKQKFFFQCGGSTQPYHAVLKVPYGGCVIRMRNKKFIEDGLCEFTIVPHKLREFSASELEPTLPRW